MTDPMPMEERRRLVAEMTRDGMTARYIAAMLGVTEKTVVRDRRATGTDRAAWSPFTAAELDLMRRLLDDGAPYAEVARTTGRSHRQIRHHFPGYGWTRSEASRFHQALRGGSPRLVHQKETTTC